LFQLGNKAVLTNTDYLSITVIESNVNLSALKLESSTTITTKIKTYANFETFATSSEQVANLTGNTNILTLC
jgi:hypothetical protein